MNHNSYSSTNSVEQSQMPDYPDVQISPTGAEFMVGNVHYSYLGPTDKGELFKSVGPDGLERPIMVYESQSQGAKRISQGYESYQRKDGSIGKRLLKGAELSPHLQYTQDTQLHPEFEAAVERISEDRKLRHLPPQPTQHYDDKAANWLMKDFEAQTSVYPLGSVEVDKALTQLRAGHLSKNDTQALTGVDPDVKPLEVHSLMMQKIHALNDSLERSGIMPDFNAEPSSTQIMNYPLIGDVVKDTYFKIVDGVRYEWQMAHVHNSNAAWIERIRFADAEPSVYGTDKQLVNSGILTSKPLEYSNQCDGVSSLMRRDLGNGYSDITPFLGKIAPIANYATSYNSREQFYHFANAA